MHRHCRSLRLAIAIYVAGAVAALLTSACGAWLPVAKLERTGAAEGDQFGRAVGISGPYAIVGAMFADARGIDSGAVEIFEESDGRWTSVPMPNVLDHSPEPAGHHLGASVGIRGNQAIAGAPGDRYFGGDIGHASAAYPYVRDSRGWAFGDFLVTEPPADYAPLGDAVAINGPLAIAGSWDDDVRGSNSGSLAVFIWEDPFASRWRQLGEKVVPADGAADDWFGMSVSLSSLALVGAPHDDTDAGADAGSAYLFTLDGGPRARHAQVAKLTASDGGPRDLFGYSVSIDGRRAVVGAPHDDDGGNDSGSAYVFESSGGAWRQVAKLTPEDHDPGDEFGISVSVSGDWILVGARGDDESGHDAGAAYVFKGGGSSWTQKQKLMAWDRAPGSEFGVSVSLSGTVAIVGAPRQAARGRDAGAAFIFAKTDE